MIPQTAQAGIIEETVEQAAQKTILSAVAAYRQGDFAKSIAVIERSGLAPRSAELAYLKGACSVAAKQLAEGVACFDNALALKPDFDDAWCSRGMALVELGRNEEALASLDKVVARRPADANAWHHRGIALLRLGRPAEALACLEAAGKLRPDSAEALAYRGAALQQLGRPAEALAFYDAALAKLPAATLLWTARGAVLEELGRPGEALASYDKALALRPDLHEACYNRGNALKSLGRLEEALAAYDRATELKPAFAEGWSNRGVALRDLGLVDAALLSFETALRQDPGCQSARFNRGTTLLLKGDLAGGWPDYESRWLHARAPRKFIEGPWPPYEGQDLEGRTLVVHAEQGMGDMLQFVRYLTLLKGKDRRIVFAAPQRMHRILKGGLDGIELRADFGPEEPADFQCPLMSLPYRLGSRLETIPAPAAYLAAEPDRIRHFGDRIGHDGFRIGIVWQGKPTSVVERGRSVPLTSYAPLALIPGARLISLQKWHGLDQLGGLPHGMRIATLGEEFDSGPDAFIDTAAAMMSLDLVVTSDTSVAHLAGALGRRVFVALKRLPDWRWMLQGDGSPWYPSMRLFRQAREGDWPEVFGRIAAETAKLAAMPARS